MSDKQMSDQDVLDQRVSVDPQTAIPHLRGVVFIHACPQHLAAHVEWALANTLGPSCRLRWEEQPAIPGWQRSDLSYRAPVGTAARIASELRTFPGIRYEVTQEPYGSVEGERYAFTPTLGIFRASIGVHGDIMINEDRLRSALARAGDAAQLRTEIDRILGTDWDEELETFRFAGDGAGIRWLHEVG